MHKRQFRPSFTSPSKISKQGEVLFNVAFKFDVNGFDNWKPEQIAAFLKGLGDVVAIQDVSKERGA